MAKGSRFDCLRKKFSKRMQAKLALVFMVVMAVFVILIGRITFINASSGDRYTKIVLNQQVYGSRTIPFKRGDIVDRNGTKLATSERVYHLILDVKVLLQLEDCIEPTVKVLTEEFGIAESDVRTALRERANSNYVILQKGMNYDMYLRYEEITGDKEKYPNVKGIWLEEDYVRTYPYNSLASTVIGFAGSSNIGAIGIENAYNSILNGTNGREYGYLDDDSILEQTVKPAENGKTVVSTIDAALQAMVEDCVLDFNKRYAVDGNAGSKNTGVIVMDPNNAEILAMVSYPDFNLNDPESLRHIYSEEKLEEMTDEEKVTAKNKLWRNFCVSDAFEPGSTMKPFTVAMGLETGALDGSEVYNCGGYLHVGDHDIYCHLRSGHGEQNVEDAIANSCNVALMHMAEAIGMEDFTEYQRTFGFGQYTGIDLPSEANTESLLYTADNMMVTDLATNSFGQSFNVSMIQMASGFCSLVNGGYFYEPHIVKQIQDENGNVIETKEPVLLKKTITEETSVLVKQYMKAVVDRGTGTAAAVAGYDIGGKTGTAEKLPRGNGKYVLSFIGYAPQENPEVVVFVVIDEPNVGNQSASYYVTQLSHDIMAKIFPYLNITMSDPDAVVVSRPEEWNITSSYQDYSEDLEDDYDKEDGDYSDEDHEADHTDWADSDDDQDDE